MTNTYGVLHKNNIKNTIDHRLYSGFVEHMGRGIYGGLYENSGLEKRIPRENSDVKNLVSSLGVTDIRYPGGNFVSGYDWKDGIGDVLKRPTKIDLAWQAKEPNTIGIHEFYDWTKSINSNIIYAVNLGTGSPSDAIEVLEYSNIESGTYWSDLRIENGHKEPFNIKTWCLGNEMDGPWQIEQKTARDYGVIAREAAKMMKLADDSIELIVCGSSYPEMDTFGIWEYEVLMETYEYIDYISIHQYYGNKHDDIAIYLAESHRMSKFIETVISVIDLVKKIKGSTKEVNISFDEWNVWFHTLDTDVSQEKMIVGREILEDTYNFEDALVIGGCLITLLEHSDRVKIACLAQLVNVIAPIRCDIDGKIWKQTTYFPFEDVANNGHGSILDLNITTDHYMVNDNRIPFIEAVGTISEDSQTVSIFILNRHQSENRDINLTNFLGDNIMATKFTELEGYDLKQTNIDEEVVKTQNRKLSELVITEDNIHFEVKPLSWNVLTLKVGDQHGS